tara:strand:- start:370 stop:549 length:180 start_codon:yes stop_codon:yes gene_type:complete
MIKLKESIPLWEYQVSTVIDDSLEIEQKLDFWGMKGYECFFVTKEANGTKHLYFKKPKE